MTASWGPATFFIQRRKSTTKAEDATVGVTMLDGEEFAFNADLEDFENEDEDDEGEGEGEDEDEDEGYGSMLSSRRGGGKRVPLKVSPSRSILSAAAGNGGARLKIEPESPKQVEAVASYTSVSSPYDKQLLLRKRYRAGGRAGKPSSSSSSSSPSSLFSFSSSSVSSVSRSPKLLFPAASTSPGVRQAQAQAERQYKAVSSPMGHSLRQRKFHGQSKQNSDEKARKKRDVISEFGSPPSLRLGRLKADTSSLQAQPSAISSSPYGGALLARKRRMSENVKKKIEL